MNVEVLINAHAGARPGEAGVASVDEALTAAGVNATIRVVPGDEMSAAAARSAARGVDAVVAAGGDGTVNAVAAALAGGQTPLGVLPLGTLNHFAKDNGIPVELVSAARVIATGQAVVLDVGRINDRIFINNSSLGVYAQALIGRDVRRDQHGLGKWPAMLLASWKVFRRSPLLHVRLTTDDDTVHQRTPLVFVGNNQYQLDLFRVGSRACLDAGVLSLYIAHTSTRWGMLKLGLRAAVGRLQQSRDFETQCVQSVQVDSRRSRVHVAIDGEVAHLATPLDYSIWPRALRVLVPRDEQQAATGNGSSGAE